MGSIDSVTLVAEAKDFPGYQFDHWATGYVDDSNQGTTVTDNSNFVLRGSRPFDGILYTAVYAVSYTHLDVYKRQASHRGGGGKHSRCA